MGHDTIWCIGRGHRLDDGGRAIESMWPLFKHDRFQFMSSMHIPREQVTMKAIAGGTLFHVHVSVPVLPLRPVAGASSVTAFSNNVATMFTIQGYKTKVATAVSNLSRMVSFVDPSYLSPIDGSLPPDAQIREILRRRGAISAMKTGIKKATEVLKEQFEALTSFINTQDNRALLSADVEQFWNDQKGDQIQQQAQDIITALETQLIMDESIEMSLRSSTNSDIVSAIQTLSITGTTPGNEFVEHPSPDASKTPRHVRFATIDPEPTMSPYQPIQLRRLELPTFDGDITQFHGFWCKFKTAVHENDSLQLSTKFIYLTNSLKGRAALIIQGYDPSVPENYHLAIQALKKRFDRPHFTHNLFHQRLEELPTASPSATSQRDTLCQIQSYILQINRFEDTTSSLVLMKTIRKKFPKETQMEVNKLEHRSGKVWTLPELLDGLNEVIEELEKLDDYSNTNSQPEFNIHPVSTHSRSPSPEPRYNPNRCCFCDSSAHSSTRCHHRLPPHTRRAIARSYQLCWKCLRKGHVSSSCGYPKCSTCNGSHHKILCVKQSDYINSYDHSRRRSRERYRSTESNRSRSPEGYSRSPSYDGRRPPTPTPERVHSFSYRTPNAERPYTPTSQDTPIHTAVELENEYEQLMHFYQGNDYNEVQLSTSMAAPRSSTLPRSVTTITFGAVRTTEHSGIVDVILIDLLRKPLQLSVRTKNKITVPCPALHITPEDRDALQDLSIAPESITATRQVTPDILIGIDYFWDIVTTDPPHTLPSGLVLCYTRFGPSISGSQFFR
ncbi:Tas retrotransposon peptidase A16 [Ostertagia ostertagi]